MSDDALDHDALDHEGASQEDTALAVGQVAERARTLHALGVLRQPVREQDVAELLTSHPWLIPGLNPSVVAELPAAGTILRLARGVATSLDRLITTALIDRSSLGTTAARSIRAQAPSPRIEAILRRRADLTGEADGDRAGEQPTTTTCAVISGQRQPYLNGGIGALEGAAIRDHLGTCVTCLIDYGKEAVMREIIAMGNQEGQPATDQGHPSARQALRVSDLVNPASPQAVQAGRAEQPRAEQSRAEKSLRVLVLGGDGFCGWPTSLYLSDRGHDVTIVDNLSRRNIDTELEVQSLTPIRPMGERLAAWRESGGAEIGFVSLDLAREYDRLVRVLEEVAPDAIVHFAEQRAAPYSMRTTMTKRYTVDNNVRATHNLLVAMVATGSTAALAHLGTMGVYGYGWSGSAPIPEGYLTVKVPTPDGDLEREILHPANPGSVYHMTKTLDQLMFAFYAKNDKLRITDLHQGIVWGTQTDQSARDERLINRFDYDGDYGTVLNRFLMQAAIGHPLTVHGSGGQTRAFIHIKDTVRCIEIAITNPPQAGSQPMVLNQITETHRVADLAKMVADIMGAQIAYLPNPRQEADENDLVVRNDQFLALGLNPTTLSNGLLGECIDIATKYRHRADPTKIIARSVWRKGMETAQDLVTELPLL